MCGKLETYKQLSVHLLSLVSSLLIMSILNFLEKKLGSLHNWPQDILRYVFYVRPSCFTTKEVSAFFNGNKIPRDIALEIFQEYNNPSSKRIELFCEKYDEWQMCEGQNHLYQYYNMSIGRMVYLNGSDHEQLELVENDSIHIEIGFGDFFPDIIKKE